MKSPPGPVALDSNEWRESTNLDEEPGSNEGESAVLAIEPVVVGIKCKMVQEEKPEIKLHEWSKQSNKQINAELECQVQNQTGVYLILQS